MLQAGGVKIWRPRQLYIGQGERDYVEVDDRQEKEGDVFSQPGQIGHGGDSKRNQMATFKDEHGEVFKPKL